MSSITIRSNKQSLNALRRFDESTRLLQQSFTRLSSGLRINKAGDDAAGLAIADSLNVDSRVFSQGIRNINDGISVLNVAEGSLQELRNLTIRQLELAEQSANGVFTLEQREALHAEADSLSQEFNRIVRSTKFNGQNLLDQSLEQTRIQGGYGLQGGVAISLGTGLGLNRADGTYSAQLTTTTTDNDDLVLEDVNGDGIVDAIGSESDLDVFIGRGDGTFAAGISYAASISEADEIIGGDFNGDGFIDFALRDYTSAGTAILIGAGDGTFSEIQSFNSIANSDDMSVGDFNNDGHDDLVFSGDSNAELRVYLSDESGKMGLSEVISTVGQIGELSVADFDADGINDFAVADVDADEINVYFGKGNGTFQSRVTINVPSGAETVSSGDYNRDGYADVAFTDGNNIQIYHGGSGRSFSAGETLSAGYFTNEIKSGDINRDGYIDIVTNRPATGETTVFLGSGDGSFSAGSSFTLNGGAVRIKDAFKDIDGDGANDLVASGLTEFVVHSANATLSSDVEFVSLLTKNDAKNALGSLREQLTRIGVELGNVGEVQSRLSTAVSNLAVARENFVTAESQIRDADVAFEAAGLVRRGILQQAAAAVLSQANQGPALALRLLQG